MNCTCSTRIKIKKQNEKAFWHALVANKGWEEKGQQNFVALTQIFEKTDLKLQASGPSTHEKLRIVTFKSRTSGFLSVVRSCDGKMDHLLTHILGITNKELLVLRLTTKHMKMTDFSSHKIVESWNFSASLYDCTKMKPKEIRYPWLYEYVIVWGVIKVMELPSLTNLIT